MVAAPTVVAGVPINAVGSSKVAGLAYFAQHGQRLDYHVVVYGLTPGSAHAVHIHGPNLSCAKQAGVASVDVGFPDLKANAHGVAAASGTVDLSTVKFKQPLAHGFYYNIHAYPTPQLASKGLAPIACGNITTTATVPVGTKSTLGLQTATVITGVPIEPVGRGGVHGLAYFAQRGQRLDYHVVVYGLTPGSAHAVHIHGPNLPCAKQAGVASVDVGFPDLKANAHGVAAASGTVDLSTIKFKQPLAHGFYYNIHAYPTAQLASKGLAPIACGNIATAGNATAAPASAPAASNASAGSRSKTIEVGMKEFAFLLSTNRALLGTVIFHLKNIGAVAHDFRIDGKTSPIVQPGKSASLTVTFTKKGSYPYLCTIPGHAQAGMKGVLHVV